MFGNTANPYDHKRTPGGSSGGEAALIGAGGSILGIGSDVGGSLRIPAHFSGVCGLKPSLGRSTLDQCWPHSGLIWGNFDLADSRRGS